MPRFLTIISICVLTCFAGIAMASNAPNPAAVFCVDQGGSYSIVNDAEGQRGICRLADGREVDAWAYFREKHSPNTQIDSSTKLANPAATFCIAEGGSYAIVDGADGTHGVCTLPGGREVDAWEYFRERHSSVLQPRTTAAIADPIVDSSQAN